MPCYEQLCNDIQHQGFHLADDFLDQQTARDLRDMALDLAETRQYQTARIGRLNHSTSNTDIRRDQLHWLDEDSQHPAIARYFQAMNDLAQALNENLFLGLAHFETHFALYPPGAFYKKHVDQFHNTQDRRLSCVYYLNDHWEEDFGGQLTLYDKNDNLLTDVLPLGNRLICFLSDLPHEVCLTHQTRLSLAGWMKARALG